MRTEYFQSGRDITISYPVEINGIRTRVVEAGEGDEVLVCIHGVGSRADRFIPAMPDLTSQGYRVIAIDLPGHGFASKPPDFNYRPKEFAAFIGGVLDLLDLEASQSSEPLWADKSLRL
nr:alpha/beta fold hydrolase [Corynebacterium sp. CNJ-954]